MSSDDWPDWLPSDWSVQIRKIDERKVKCYLDPNGQKFYSKPQVLRHLKMHLKTINNSSTGGISQEPDDLHTDKVPESSPQVQSTIRTSGRRGRKPKGYLAGDGASSDPEASHGKNGVSGWLPDGWTVEVKTRGSGSHPGMKYKCYKDPTSGKKFFSKPQVLNYLASTNSSVAGLIEGDKSSTVPNKSQKYEAANVRKNKAKDIATFRKPFEYELISRTPADGLPPGWIKEIRVRKNSSLNKKDPFYLDPLSGYTFFSKLDALRYLDSGDIKKCAMRPLRRDTGGQEYHTTNVNDPSNGNETSEVLPNGRVTESRTRSKLSATGDGSCSTPVASQKEVSEWLPDGWATEIKVRDSGQKFKCYTESASGRKFYSKPQVLSYLASISRKRKGDQSSTDPDSSWNTEPDDFRPKKRSKKKKKGIQNSTFEEAILASPADGLPPGWIKEIRTRKYSTHERKDPYYTDPVSGYIFRSKVDALRYLETGDVNLCAIRPKMKDSNGKEIPIPANDGQKPANATTKKQLFEDKDVENSKDDASTDAVQIIDENHPTSVSTTPSGRVTRTLRGRPARRAKAASPALPARSSKRIKETKPDTKAQAVLTDKSMEEDGGGGAVEETGVNVEKQGDDDHQLCFELGDDEPGWTDQCLDFAVKTLTGEIPVNGRDQAASVAFEDEEEVVVNEDPTKVN